MSCNGCRVLRKGCSDTCTIRPCLQWIKSPESQANATVFLAKFYGRAGLLNLINAGPDHLRPAIFRSLLYEACGRIVNPVYGSAGLLWSGSWQLCQAAVEAVLSGSQIIPVASDSAVGGVTPPLKACDIRHVSRDEASTTVSQNLHRVKSRNRFKRTAASKQKPNPKPNSNSSEPSNVAEFILGSNRQLYDLDSVANRNPEASCLPSHGGDRDSDSVSVETVEASLAKADDRTDGSDVELELTLGLQPVAKSRAVGREIDGVRKSTCKVEIGLDVAV